jgi:hypothetical protein
MLGFHVKGFRGDLRKLSGYIPRGEWTVLDTEAQTEESSLKFGCGDLQSRGEISTVAGLQQYIVFQKNGPAGSCLPNLTCRSLW